MQFFDESRMLLIAFALMGISTIALFFWFKQRISLIENKLETMFQLIQSHSEEPFEGTLDDPNFTMTESLHQHNVELSNDNNTNAYVNRNLMQVSDDDSDEVSDNDSDNESDNESDNKSDNDKKMEMVVESIPLKPSSLEELQNVELNKKDLVELSFNVNNDNDNDDNDSLDELDDDDDDNNIKKVTVEELTNYNILKVSELKNECKKKGLEGYSNLKKQELVELLNNSE